MENDEATTPAEASPQPPAYVRKQALQPKPLAAGLFGVRGEMGRASFVVPVSVIGIVLLVITLGLGIANANSGPSKRGQIATNPVATATVTQASALTIVPTATPSPTATPQPTATATPLPTATPRPALPPPPPPTATHAPSCNFGGAPANPWCYTFINTGKLIYSPGPPSSFCNYFNCISSFWSHTNGYVDECKDGTYSHSGGVRGACSYHGGELRPLYQP